MSAEKEKKYIPNDEFYSAVRQTLEEGSDVDLTVTGNSMWPLLRHGRDRVVLTLCRPEEIRKGDVILFEALPSKFLLHRVTKISDKKFETTGDFNCFRDGNFPESCVIGKTVKVIRKGKTYDAKSLLLRFYSFIWMALFPIRKPLVGALFLLSRINNNK